MAEQGVAPIEAARTHKNIHRPTNSHTSRIALYLLIFRPVRSFSERRSALSMPSNREPRTLRDMTTIKSAMVVSLALGLVAGCGNDDDKKKSSNDSGTPSGWQAAVGEDGTFAQTFDGVSWSTRALNAYDLFGVTCVGNLDGWAVGESGFIGRTRDGGQTWQTQASGTTLTLRSVHFAHDHLHFATSTLTGVTAGDAGVLAVSINGGEDWKLIDSGVTSSLRGASSALNADLIVVVGDGGTVLRSTDLGAHFGRQTLAGAGDLRAVAVAPGGDLILSVDSKGQIWGSTDLGKTFHVEATAAAPLHAVAVAPDGSKAIAAGDAGTALRRDASGHWSVANTGSTLRLNAALLTHDGVREFLAGESGLLLGSEDQGASWQSAPLGTTAALYGLEDLDPH